MRKFFGPLLLLATAALSSSNLLQTDNREPFNINGQSNDNIPLYSNKYQPINIISNIFCKQSRRQYSNNPLLKLCRTSLINRDDNSIAGGSSDDVINKQYNYNGEGFRQEQWHNYPRQLDRLHRYLYEYDVDKNLLPDPGEAEDYLDVIPLDYNNNYIEKANEHLKRNHITEDYDTLDDLSDPLLILKIKLFAIENNKENTELCKSTELLLQAECKQRRNDIKSITNEINPTKNLKVKREGSSNNKDFLLTKDGMTGQEKKVKKRIFSLWSRLQGMAHQGHELPHRRHFHAYYGLSDGEGGGTLTAETRDGLRRPPGAPLRWG